MALQVVPLKPVHLIPGQKVASSILRLGWNLGDKIGGGIDQQLKSQLGFLLIKYNLRNDGGEVTARTSSLSERSRHSPSVMVYL